MRTAAKVDRNQPEIVAALRRVGATVLVLSAVGRGCPDIVVGYHGVNYFIEIKDGEKPPSERRLTPDQVEWHGKWRGRAGVAETMDDALRIIGAIN